MIYTINSPKDGNSCAKTFRRLWAAGDKKRNTGASCVKFGKHT